MKEEDILKIDSLLDELKRLKDENLLLKQQVKIIGKPALSNSENNKYEQLSEYCATYSEAYSQLTVWVSITDVDGKFYYLNQTA